MSELLERRYRSVLRLLPEDYRRERESEMVAAFLEAAGDVSSADNPRPGWGEVGSVLALALRLRLGGQDSAPRAFARGEAVRLVALLGLGFQAALSVVTAAGGVAEPLFFLAAAEACCWVVAFLSLVRGHLPTAKGAAVLALLPVTGTAAFQASDSAQPASQTASWLVLAVVPVIALLLAYHRDVLPVTRPWWQAMVPLTAAVFAASLAALPRDPTWSWSYPWTDPIGLGVLALVAGVAAGAIRRPAAPWRLALGMVAALLMAVRLLDMADMYGDLLITGSVQVALLAVLATGLTITGRRALPEPV